MAGPISPQDLARLRQAMFLGLARQPLSLPETLGALLGAAPGREPALAALALAGQRQRFERPAFERSVEGVPEAARRLHDDRRPILPEPARRLLLRLANGAEKAMADAVVRAAVRRVAHARLRPHPFDLPRLIGYIKDDARCLGLAERAYLALADTSPGTDALTFLHVEITVDNWTEFPKAYRVAFLRRVRKRSPDVAREMLEEAFKTEPAAVRADLLAALDVRLGADDVPFLERLSRDRAESVRTVAARLAASVPGTPGHAARLVEAAACFTRKDTPVSDIMKRVGLASATPVRFTPSKAANQAQRRTALEGLFLGLSVRDIGAAASLPMDEVVAAVPASEEAVLAAFSQKALTDGDGEALLRLTTHRLAHVDAERFRAGPLLQELVESLTGPAPAELGRALLDSPGWQASLRRLKEATTPAAMKDDGTLIWTAALLPAELLPAFQDSMSGLLPAVTRTARDFLDLVHALDTANPKGDADGQDQT